MPHGGDAGRWDEETHAERGRCSDERDAGAGAQRSGEWEECCVLKRQVSVGLYCIYGTARAAEDKQRGAKERGEGQT
jgi:hypothetical protein